MNFEQFAAAYREAFAELMRYKPDEVGSIIWAERMAKLADEYPDWAAQVEAQA